MKKSSKVFAGILIGGVIASGGLFAGCGGGEGDTEVLSKTSDVYGFAGATTSMLASNDVVAEALTVSAETEISNPFAELETQLQSTISETLDEYMAMFDNVVGGTNPVSTTTETLTEGEYAHKMTITMTSASGETRKVYFYFNETLSNGDQVEDTDDEESETIIDGKLVAGDLTLYVGGQKEVEGDETEVEFRVSVTKNDTQNYIKFSQEHESDEEEYHFVIVRNGAAVAGTEFTLDLDKHDDGTIELEYEKAYNGTEFSFKIEKTANNEISVKTDMLGNALTIKIASVEEEGQMKYQYSVTVGELFNFQFDGNFQLI